LCDGSGGCIGEDAAAAGEAEEAVVVVRGGDLGVGAALLRVPERGGDAVPAAGEGAGHVAAAQRQRVHRVGGPAGGGGGEQLRGGGGGFAGEGPGQGPQVALVGAVGRVVAGVAAHRPGRRRGPPWLQQQEQEEAAAAAADY